MDFSKGFSTEIILIGENSSWSQKLDYENVSFRCRVCFETGHKATHFPKRPRQAKKHQRKSTWWVGAKEEHQMISKVEPDALDLPMDEPKSKSEEIRDTPSKKKDVDPHDPMKEEVVIPQIWTRKHPKSMMWHHKICGKGLFYSLRSGPKGELGRPRQKKGRPLNNMNLQIKACRDWRERHLKSSKRKEAWTTVVKKKKLLQGAQSVVTRSQTRNPI
jgi:hypothetical protein